jgi:hypothetical protein
MANRCHRGYRFYNTIQILSNSYNYHTWKKGYNTTNSANLLNSWPMGLDPPSPSSCPGLIPTGCGGHCSLLPIYTPTNVRLRTRRCLVLSRRFAWVLCIDRRAWGVEHTASEAGNLWTNAYNRWLEKTSVTERASKPGEKGPMQRLVPRTFFQYRKELGGCCPHWTISHYKRGILSTNLAPRHGDGVLYFSLSVPRTTPYTGGAAVNP